MAIQSLNVGQNNGSIVQYLRPSFSYNLSLRSGFIFVCLKTGLTVTKNLNLLRPVVHTCLFAYTYRYAPVSLKSTNILWASAWDFQQCGMCDQQSLRSACAYAQSDQSLCSSLEYSMNVKLLTEHHLEFLSLKGGCRGSSESTLVKMSNCWKSHAAAPLREHLPV